MATAPASRPTLSTNEGHTDRVLRVIVGGIILALGVTYGSWWGLIGLIPLVTGLVGFCPLYALFGIDTCPVRKT